jgi:outer membrane protein assembly factor BamB
MSFSRFLFFLLLITCAGCSHSSNENPPVTGNHYKKKIAGPKEPEKEGVKHSYHFVKASKYQFDGFSCRIGDTILLCSAHGKVSLADSSGKIKSGLFDFHCEYLVDDLYAYPLKKDTWLVGWSETNHEGQNSHMAVFTAGKDKPDWIFSFPVMNIGPFALDDQMVYFTTIGMVAKVDADEGKMQWKIDSLFNPSKWAYNKFESPLVYDDRVEFVDMPVPGRRDRRDTIAVDPQTGARKK